MPAEALPALPLNPTKCRFSLVHLQLHFQQRVTLLPGEREKACSGHERLGLLTRMTAAVPHPVPPPCCGFSLATSRQPAPHTHSVIPCADLSSPAPSWSQL